MMQWIGIPMLGCILVFTSSVWGDDSAKPAWQIRQLALDANEGCALGDIDGDGKLDVVAGRNWYAAPDFIPRPVRVIEDWNGYIQSNGDFLFDVNADGRLDVVAISFVQTEIHWFENPGPEGLRLGQLWPKHVWVDTQLSENEAEWLYDLDQDGRPEFLVNSWNPKNPLMVWRIDQGQEGDAKGKWILNGAKLAASGNSHGMGAGDLNGDGLNDVLTGAGWYQQPSENPWGQPWTYHADWQIAASIPMLVHDVDRDGRQDILVGMGHDYGLSWWRQVEPASDGKLQFDQKMIDKSYSQPHALALADLDGDGDKELISGKRYFAHNGGDPGGREMPTLAIYDWNQEKATWSKQVVDEGHVGIGLQIATGDLNGDQAIDIAVAGKSGTYLLFNPQKPLVKPQKPLVKPQKPLVKEEAKATR